MTNENLNEKDEGSIAKHELAVRCNLSNDDEIGLYEKFLDEFTDKDGVMKPCNPDAVFNWFGWQLWRSRQ